MWYMLVVHHFGGRVEAGDWLAMLLSQTQEVEISPWAPNFWPLPPETVQRHFRPFQVMFGRSFQIAFKKYRR